MMNFINLAHCAFAMLGGFVAITLVNSLGWPFLATSADRLHRGRRRRGRRWSGRSTGASIGHRELEQVLLTIGIVFMSVATAAYLFGTVQQTIQMPAFLRGSFHVLGLDLGAYRLFLIGAGLLVTVVLVAMLEYTRFGARVRAAVDNQRMARGLGINVEAAFAITFALGSGLAGLGGALAIEIVGARFLVRLQPTSSTS